MEIGQVCVKIAGRDAGKKCVIVEVLEKNLVLIDGETRRRKCNIHHIEPIMQKVEIKRGALHEEVMLALGLEVKVKKEKKVTVKENT